MTVTTLTPRKKRTGPGRPCTICEHPDCRAIDDDLLCGVRYRTIAARYSVASHHNVIRHAQSHVAALYAPAAEDDIFQPEGLRRSLRNLTERMTRMLDELEQSKPEKADKAAREVRMCLQLAAQISGEIESREARISEADAQALVLAAKAVIEAAIAQRDRPADELRAELPKVVRAAIEATATG